MAAAPQFRSSEQRITDRCARQEPPTARLRDCDSLIVCELSEQVFAFHPTHSNSMTGRDRRSLISARSSLTAKSSQTPRRTSSSDSFPRRTIRATADSSFRSLASPGVTTRTSLLYIGLAIAVLQQFLRHAELILPIRRREGPPWLDCAQLEATVVVQVVEPQASVVPIVRLLVHTPTQRPVLRLDHLQVVDPRVL